MKNKIFFLILIFIFSSLFTAFAQAPTFTYNPKTDNVLGISTGTPPVIVWVVDLNGLRTGADPSVPINTIGEQVSNYPWGLREIPNSVSEQDNEDIPGSDIGQPPTGWTISIKTSSAQSFVINCKGVSMGVGNLTIRGLFPNHRTREIVNLLTSVGETHQINVNFNPGGKKIKATRVVLPGDLLNDVKTACLLNLISNHICRNFENKAEAIQDALANHHHEQAEKLLRGFLSNLGELKGDGDDDRDDHDSIKEPALTILKEEAKVLLESLSGEKHHHEDR